jgi:hypothetical protein
VISLGGSLKTGDRLPYFLTIALLAISLRASGEVSICNGTITPARLAVVFNKDNVGRVVRGWWTVSPGSCVKVHDGNANVISNDLWVYAESPKLQWNQIPDCRSYEAFFNSTSTPGSILFSDCKTPPVQRTFCTLKKQMPDYPSDVMADVPPSGCEEDSKSFGQLLPVRSTDMTINLIYFGGEGRITTSNYDPALEISRGQTEASWGFPDSNISFGVLETNGIVAYCNSNDCQASCHVVGYWFVPDQDHFMICGAIDGSKNNDGPSDCKVTTNPNNVTADCRGNNKGCFKGGGHAGYTLNRVTVTSDPRYCAVEDISRCEIPSGTICTGPGPPMPGNAMCIQTKAGQPVVSEYDCSDHRRCDVCTPPGPPTDLHGSPH